MNTQRDVELWDLLSERGLVRGVRPAAPAAASPWFVRLMLGIAGWLGALFLLGFLGVGFEALMRNAGAAMLVGAMLCGGAAFLCHARSGDFATQFGFAVSLAGQGLILFGLFQAVPRSEATVALLMAAVETVLFFAITNYSHRVWSAWTGGVALAFWMLSAGLAPLAPAVLGAACAGLWLHEFDRTSVAPAWRADGYGLTLALIQALLAEPTALHWLFGRPDHARGEALRWAGNVLAGVVLLVSIGALLVREQVRQPPSLPILLVAGAVALAASLKAPGLGPLLVVVVLGHANGNRVLLGLGIAGLIAYLGMYYYWLQVTLLDKSLVLMATGFALLLIRFLAPQAWPAETGGASHA